LKKDLVLLKTLFDKAYKLYVDKKYIDSLNLLNHTSEMWIDYPQKNRFLTLIGINNYKLKNYYLAERALLESLALYPDNIRVLDILGKIYYVQERYIESERVYLKAKKNDFYNFYFSIKTARSAWKSGNYNRMFRRLKEGYMPQFIGKKEVKKLKEFLLEFLRTSDSPHTYLLIKKFRKWCYEKDKKVKKNKKNII
jgi:tetratricopeptide (TPR) repeat protein